ncbi:MAG: hypothetical protein JW966_04225 [Anaerolineae bacterium]|nr:hypothetical protein [Anaerolineae bacterium]
MSLDTLHFFLSQTNNSSGATDFLKQVSGILIPTCALGILWLVLTGLVMQRATERRRRASSGEPPLPGIYTQAYQWFKRVMNPETAPAESAVDAPHAGISSRKRAAPVLPRRPKPELLAAVPAPDLLMLMGAMDDDIADTADSVPGGDRASQQDAATDVATDVADMPSPDSAQMVGSLDDSDDTAEVIDAAEMEKISVDMGDAAFEDELGYENGAAHDQAGVRGTAPGEEPPPDSVELLRVWRDVADGSLILEIGGQRFSSLDDLRGVDLERRFLNVVHELDGVAGAGKAPRAPRRQPSPPPVEPADDDPEPASMRPGAMLRQMTRAAMGQTPKPVEEIAPLSIGDQIEDLLQARLADMPQFAGRKIHVKPAIDGGVRIEVDGAFFEGIGEVDDDDVRDLLGDVVREWEEGQ